MSETRTPPTRDSPDRRRHENADVPVPNRPDTDPQDFEAILEAHDDGARSTTEGEVVKGTVREVTDSGVVVDVGYKSDGLIPIDEFLDEHGDVTVQAGDVLDVLLERTEDSEGRIVLSREKAEKMRIWDDLQKAYARKQVVIGRVVGPIKGGLAVDFGSVRAFLPASQIDVRPVRKLNALKGRELRMRVIKINRKRGNIVLSRKVLLEKENAEKKKATIEALAQGRVLRGTVTRITDYGAFIDLGGIDGLLHITDMSWHRVSHPSELFKVNDEVDVTILEYDPATERVALGYKQLVQDPWATVQERYPLDARIGGKVVRLTDDGALIELEPGVDGLIDVSEMSRIERVTHPSKALNVGDSVNAIVLDVDPATRRIALGRAEVVAGEARVLADHPPSDSLHPGEELRIEPQFNETALTAFEARLGLRAYLLDHAIMPVMRVEIPRERVTGILSDALPASAWFDITPYLPSPGIARERLCLLALYSSNTLTSLDATVVVTPDGRTCITSSLVSLIDPLAPDASSTGPDHVQLLALQAPNLSD